MSSPTPPSHRPTLADVADAAGVAISTASRALAVPGRGNPGTRDRIIRARAAESVSVRSRRVQCRTMPIWLSVNDTNTPTM